jgi:N-acetylmuramoyl-L-alanine amidase
MDPFHLQHSSSERRRTFDQKREASVSMSMLRFDGLRSTRPRKEPPIWVVIHWTGGAGDAAQVYRTLRSSTSALAPDGLSIHYIVEPDGNAVQMCSLDLVTMHAGSPVNARSIGIECVNPGFAGTAAHKRELRAGVKRDVYEARIHDRRVKILDFTEAQHAALRVLVGQLCERYRIPLEVPRSADGAVRAGKMSPRELAAFRGVLGHLHVSGSKADPGTRPLERLAGG